MGARRGRGLRVVAGEAGGLRLVAPRGSATRPTSGRVRESLFAALGPGPVAGASVLDLFAGSGALAIEALSRGAERAVLVERDQGAVDAIRANLSTTRLAGRARVRRGSVAPFLRGSPPPEAPFDLVFLDPPYELPDADLAALLARLDEPGWLAPGAAVVVERAAGAAVPGLPGGWEVRWSRVSGDTLVVVVVPRPRRV